MNAYELNKILCAVLAAFVFAMGVSVLSDIIFDEAPLYDPAYAVRIEEAKDEAVEEEELPFSVLLASADPAAGERAARVCGACHAFEAGGANGIGPQLYNIVGRDMAAADGFGYSAALTSYGEGKTWSYDELSGFLENPQGWVSGTSMGYAGIKDPEDRADVIAYLQSVSPDGPPLPDAPAEVAAVETQGTVTDAATTEAAPADEAPAAAEPAGGGASDEQAAAPGMDSFTTMVASANPADGLAAAAICMACHTVAEGEGHRLGPNLHNVFNAPIAGKGDFDYSDAMRGYAEAHPAWNVDTLNAYLEAPMEVVAGTRMAYAGVKDDAQRAAIISWLHSISPDGGAIVASAPAGGDADAGSPAPEAAGAGPEADPAPAQSDAATDGPNAAPTASDDDRAAAPASADAEEAVDTAAVDDDEGPDVVIEPARSSRVEIVNPVQ
ncbi:MAG: c-type cytochrome [Pseudomonadota bacterium]